MRNAILFFALAAQSLQAQTPSIRSGGHVLVYDSARAVTVLIGGDTDAVPDQTRDSVWTWSGHDWHFSTVAGPSWRTLPAVAYDARRNRVVLMGGLAKAGQRDYRNAEGDTWAWDGARWERLQVNSPGPVDHHAMVYDAQRDMIVMQGGGAGGQILPGVTWGFDGTAWRVLADATAGPGERVHHAMAYDSRRGRVVLYGGFGNDRDDARRAETWEWDGRSWTRVATDGPGPRARHRLAYDAARGVTVLFGGNDDPRTWGWDGAEWRVLADTGPSPRNMHAMSYDSGRQRVVLYGGNPGGGELWEWDGTAWSRH